MPFFLPLLLQAYDPEIEAVMNRSRRQKQEERAAAASAASATVAPASTASSTARDDGRIPVPEKFAVPFQQCLDAAIQSPQSGISFAEKWRIEGGSFYARHCMGFAYARAERWAPAIVAFEQAAEEAGCPALGAGGQCRAREWRCGQGTQRFRRCIGAWTAGRAGEGRNPP
jgi:hypothetical protein